MSSGRRSRAACCPGFSSACWRAHGSACVRRGGSRRVNQRVQRIIASDLSERLPHRAVDEPFSKLAVIVNGMLDEIETMIHALAGVGNDIRPRFADAADARPACAGARAHQRPFAGAASGGRGQGDRRHRSITDDHHRAVALGPRSKTAAARPPFDDVALQDMLREVGDIYESIAENKSITFHVEAPHPLSVRGDRDLLIETVANLVNNVIKFTPEGGRVDIALRRSGCETVVSVTDSGPASANRNAKPCCGAFTAPTRFEIRRASVSASA
jgi:signal transduction histidine kinase